MQTLNHMMRMVNDITICVETLRQDVGSLLEKELVKLMVLNLIVNWVDDNRQKYALNHPFICILIV